METVGKPQIPEDVETGGPFEVGDTVTIYEAAMLYAGRHPGGRFLDGRTKRKEEDFGRASLEQYEKVLCPERERDARDGGPRKLAWDIFCELRKRVASGAITPVRPAYLPSGEVDPRDTRIRTADLARLADERGDRPQNLAHLMQAPETHTGLPGRPTKSRETILAEFEARRARGETLNTLAGEARACLENLKTRHPTVAVPTLKTVESLIRNEYRGLKATKL